MGEATAAEPTAADRAKILTTVALDSLTAQLEAGGSAALRTCRTCSMSRRRAGDDLPDAPSIYPTGDDLSPFLRLVDYATSAGIGVAQNVDMKAEADTDGQRIRLSTRLVGNPGALAASMAHELAHCLLHLPESPIALPDMGRPAERDLRELEAESVAYVIAHAVGLSHLDHMADYVVNWNGSRERLEASLSRIHAATKALLGVLAATTDQQEEAA